MSILPRIFRQGLTRRGYSSFFSSKPGGRYVNSARTPKTVVSTGASKGTVETTRPAPSAGSADGVNGPNSTSGKESQNTGQRNDHDEPSSSLAKSVPSSATNLLSQPTQDAETSGTTSTSSATTSPTVTSYHHNPPSSIHTTLNPHDYKLHLFFSLHRPLLLLSQPSAIIFESSSLFSPTSSTDPPPPPAHLGTLDDPPEASPEADADAARQLARALVLNRVGETVAWQATLRHLGSDVEKEAERIESKQEMQREWNEVLLDSTKRKRKKKMKKHK
jgi:hypothetical protein